jgi:hypothetical protein
LQVVIPFDSIEVNKIYPYVYILFWYPIWSKCVSDGWASIADSGFKLCLFPLGRNNLFMLYISIYWRQDLQTLCLHLQNCRRYTSIWTLILAFSFSIDSLSIYLTSSLLVWCLIDIRYYKSDYQISFFFVASLARYSFQTIN